MLKTVMYFNVFFLGIMSFYYLLVIKNNLYDLKKCRILIVMYIIYSIINIFLCGSDMVQIDYGMLLLVPIFAVSMIFYIIDLYWGCLKIKEKRDAVIEKTNVLKLWGLGIFPMMAFLIPYARDLILLNNCTYLLSEDIQYGIVSSEESYYVIVGNRIKEITLKKNIFSREGVQTDFLKFKVTFYDGDVSVVANEYNNEDIVYDIDIIRSVALDAKERCPNVELAEIYYLSEGKYSFVELLDDEFTGGILEKYLYKGETYIKDDITFPRAPDSITYYEK